MVGSNHGTQSILTKSKSKSDGSYRREFLFHFNRTIPKRFWSSKSFDAVFDTCNDLQTFILLDNSGSYGVPIGINKSTKSIILNDSVWWTWNNFKVKFNQNSIERYQNLDFRGYEMLVNNNGYNINYEKPCQQIAIVNINKLCKSSILSYFIGQFILLDYGTDSFIPIYVYTPTIIRADQHVLMVKDIHKDAC